MLTKGGALEIKVDEVTGAADGFAIDFIRLLVNRHRENTCRGDQPGRVIDKETNAPLKGAHVTAGDVDAVVTDDDGFFLLKGLSTGYDTISASADGYNDGHAVTDVAEADNPEVMIPMDKGQTTADFGGQNVKAGETINLNNILFDQGKSDLRPESRTELDRIVAFMNANPRAEIELSGHTSSEGDAALNRSLSYQRVKACKDYVVGKGVDTGRITVVGYGPDRPVAPNDTEANRAKNRRVEMRVLKL
jgi:outer membrane protein OmpA-like peptidoglycan-associated protein